VRPQRRGIPPARAIESTGNPVLSASAEQGDVIDSSSLKAWANIERREMKSTHKKKTAGGLVNGRKGKTKDPAAPGFTITGVERGRPASEGTEQGSPRRRGIAAQDHRLLILLAFLAEGEGKGFTSTKRLDRSS